MEMQNGLKLVIGQLYAVKKLFIDYDNVEHSIGETWVYRGTQYNAYHQGMVVYISVDNVDRSFRLEDYDSSQAEIIATFNEYVEPW